MKQKNRRFGDKIAPNRAFTFSFVYRPTTGTWYVLKSSTALSTYFGQGWGNYGDQPVPADYDGDGNADFAVWRPTSGVWYVLNSKHLSDPNYPEYSYDSLGVIGNGNRIAERRLRFVGLGVYAQEATFLQRADPSGVEVVDTVVHNSASWNFELWGNGNNTVDPLGAGIGYENPYPPPPVGGFDPDHCTITDWGDDYYCEMPSDYDDQSNENTGTGSVEDDTCYDSRGLKVKCIEHGDVVTLKDNQGKLYLAVFDANNVGYHIGDTFISSHSDGRRDLPSQNKKPTLISRKKGETKQIKGERIRSGVDTDPKNEEDFVPFDMDGIRAGLVTVWEDSGCRDLIQGLLADVSSKSNPIENGGNLVSIFDRLRAGKGGLARKSATNNSVHGASITGSLRGNDATIIHPSIGNGRTVNMQLIADIRATANEIMHLAGRSIYSDQDFAAVVRDNPIWAQSNWLNDITKEPEVYPDYRPEFSTQAARDRLHASNMPYSGYWHPVMDNLCLDRIFGTNSR